MTLGTEQLRTRAADLAAMEARLELARSELASLEERAAAHNLRIAGLVKLIERRAEIEAGFADLKEARQTIDSLGRTLAMLNDLQRQRASVDTKLAVRRERVNSALDAERSRPADLTIASQSVAQLQAAQVSVAEDRKAVTYQEQQAEELRSTLSSLRAESEVLDSQAGELRSQMENTRNRLISLSPRTQRARSVDSHSTTMVQTTCAASTRGRARRPRVCMARIARVPNSYRCRSSVPRRVP